MFIDQLIDTIRRSLEENSELPEAVFSRVRIERPIQFAAHARLVEELGRENVRADYCYPEPQKGALCDFWYKDGEEESWVELKLFVTNYEPYSGGHSQPAALHMQNILLDIEKLRRLPASVRNRHLIVIAYPMPQHYATYQRWSNRLDEIRAANVEPQEVFTVAAERFGQRALVVGYRIDV